MKVLAFLKMHPSVAALFMGALCTFLVYLLDGSMEFFRYVFMFFIVTLIFYLMGRNPAPSRKPLNRDDK